MSAVIYPSKEDISEMPYSEQKTATIQGIAMKAQANIMEL